VIENQRDPAATRAAQFASKESYVSWRGHVYLYGQVDHEFMRLRLFRRSHGRCEHCGKPTGWKIGEWHHAQDTRGGRRCDGLCCAMWLCEKCHLEKPKLEAR